ncbi:MAG: hypothetical protein Q8O84_03055 [Nanoarchaeota archaeon]|nr:hypothetical protein [Nanoarchaeota archaeon]
MIVEFFGLSNTGKSVLKRELEKKGYKVSRPEKISKTMKFFLFVKHLILNPLNSIYLFNELNSNRVQINLSPEKKSLIRKMRNSYLVGVLAKYEYLKNKEENIFTDEFSLQSLFMILQKKSNEKEIRKIIKKLPKSDYLFLFEGNKEWRHKAYQKKHPIHSGTLMPGSGIDKDYAEEWMEIMEYNFEIIKKIILENYQEDKETFKELKLKYPKIYKKK